LHEQGYGELDGLAPCYADTSQTLLALGHLPEAITFDEKAYAEAQRLVEAGHSSSKRDIWIYRVNRGCLYLRLGRIDEAEHLLREAMPHIAKYRRMYRMFAREALEEIERWRRSTTSPHHQLDWRWVERYRTLAAADSFWWLAPAGPFSQEEQQEWDQSFSHHLDEATKERLGTLMARSTQREVQNALDEQREPSLSYPALDIDAVRQRVADFSHLRAEVEQEEPHALVRRLYQDVIEEELDFLHLIEATYEVKSEQFREHMARLVLPPTGEEMEYVLSRVRHYIFQGLLRPETREASERLIQILRDQCGYTLNLLYIPQEEQELDNIEPLAPSQQQSRKIPAQAAKRFFEAIFRESGFDGWRVEIDPKVRAPRVEFALRCLFLENSSFSVKQIKQYLSHELAVHVARCIAGARSLIGLLGIMTKNALEIEEGMALYYETQEAGREGRRYDETAIWWGTLATGLASGVMVRPQTFRSLFTFYEAFVTLYRLVRRPDQDIQMIEKNARRIAMTRCLRVFRGVPDLTCPGVCYTQDALYLRGLWKIERAIKEDACILDRLAVGKVTLELLPDLQALGMVSVPQPLRLLAEDPQLDAYILSFDSAEENESQREDKFL
jgi:hypothetical protein